jgi:hypothetical protein
VRPAEIELGLQFAQGWSELLVEFDQAVGCCAYVVFGHGGFLLIEPRIDDEPAGSAMLY